MLAGPALNGAAINLAIGGVHALNLSDCRSGGWSRNGGWGRNGRSRWERLVALDGGGDQRGSGALLAGESIGGAALVDSVRRTDG